MKFYFHETFLFCFRAILHKRGGVENKKNLFLGSRSAKPEVKQICDRSEPCCSNARSQLSTHGYHIQGPFVCLST